MAIDEQAFRGIDLNLLVTFVVLFRELSVTRTAARLNVGQPAVSGALARLRLHFDDPLFLRMGRGVQPTVRAMDIAALLIPALRSIEGVIKQAARRGA